MDKLEERLLARAMGWDATAQANTPGHLINPDGPEAADEITRLNAEVESEGVHRAVVEAELASAQALIDEMVEVMEHVLNGSLLLPRFAEGDMRALILKARGKDSNVG